MTKMGKVVGASSLFVVFIAAGLLALTPPHLRPHWKRGTVNSAPLTQHAAVYAEYGSASDVLRIIDDHPVPQLAPHEVLIRVEAAALNPIDWKKMAGALFMLEAVTGDLGGGGSVPGFDIAGTVVGLGSSCTRIQTSQEVFAMALPFHTGALAEFVAVPEVLVATKPKNLSFEEAASIPLAGLTSLQGLRNFGQGDSVVVLGGSGGTGTLAIQLAKALGAARVIATCGSRNTQLCSRLGADVVVDYRTNDWSKAVGVTDGAPPPDLVLDCVGGRQAWDRAASVMNASGRYVTIAGDLQAAFTVPYLLARGIEIITRKVAHLVGQGPSYDFITTNSNGEELAQLAQLLENRTIVPVLDRVFDFENVVEAFEYLARGRASGKVVVRVRF